MTEQSVQMIIEALEEYGAPMLKLYAIIYVVGFVVFLVLFITVFVIIMRDWKKMDDDFDRRWKK
jgi:hypothetical protein